MQKVFITASLVLALLVSFAGAASAATGGVTDAQTLKDLAELRQATIKYQDISQALADGFMETEACVAVPGVGGMGYHFIHPARAMDPTINMSEPEVLLYAEIGGKLKLVGVEYFYAIGMPDAPIPNPAPPAPVLFGRDFDGPMLGHEPGMPPHYDLHVWLWQANPAGMFADLNPNISCP